MTDAFVDPGEPGPAGGASLRAKDLINRRLLIRPVKVGTDVGKEDGEPYKFVSCDVAVIDATGVEEHSSSVRFSWKRAIPQLESRMGQWVGATPKVQDDKSVLLMAFGERGKEIAATLMPEVAALFGSSTPEPSPPAYDDGEEPF
jgi:hypothetical protein